MSISSAHDTAAQHRFELLANTIQDVVWEWNLETQELWWNPAITSVFGHTLDDLGNQLEGKLNLIHPADRLAVQTSLDQALLPGGGLWKGDYRLRRADGTYAHVLDRGVVQFVDGVPMRVVGSIIDLTERQQLVAARNESDERAHMALESAEMGTWRLELGTNLVIWDTRCAELFGYPTNDSVMLDDLVQRMHPEDRNMVLNAIGAALKPDSDGKYRIVYRVILSDSGRIRWIRATGRAYFDEARMPLRFYGVCTDVTEERLKDIALRNLERRYQTAFTNANLGIAMADGEGHFLLINKAYEKITGYTVAELAGGTYHHLTHPDDMELTNSVVVALASGQRDHFDYEKRYIRKDGTVTWVQVNSTVIRDENGNIDTLVGICRPIDDQKHAELALRESNRQLNDLINQFRFVANFMPQLLWYTDREGNVEFYNQRWCDYTGMTMEQGVNEGWENILHPDFLQETIAVWTDAFRTGKPYQIEYKLRRHDGEYRWFLGLALPMHDDEGNIIRWFGTCTDIDDQKRFNQLLEQTVEQRTMELKEANAVLERTNRNLEQFAYVASHDLQEPLRKIRMFSNLLMERATTIDDHQRQYLTRIVDAAQRMTGLIRDLLDFSRATSQNQLFETVDLNQILAKIATDFELTLAQKQGQLVISKLPQLEAIPLHMNQLFYNLVSNGLKFTKDGIPPVVEITARRLSSAELARLPHSSNLSSPGPFWQITVRDNGIGFDPQFAEKIFVIFQRLHTRMDYEGTGIGLALCQKIVNNHHGEIWAESTPGEGSTFTLVLPERQR